MTNRSKIIQQFINSEDPVIKLGGVSFLPVLHGGYEWAASIRRYITKNRPSSIAIELPETLNSVKNKAASLLPGPGVIRYPVSSGEYRYILIESTDPLWEAARCGIELNIPTKFIDKDVEEYPEHHELFPDSSSIAQIGYTQYVKLLLKHSKELQSSNIDEADALREKTMAFHIQEMSKKHGNNLLVICGISHLNGILSAMENEIIRPLGKVKRDNVEIFSLEEESARSISDDAGYFAQKYEIWRKNSENKLPSRYEIIADALVETSVEYKKEMKNNISLHSLKNSLSYMRNLSVIKGQLAPDPYDIVLAGNSMIDHDFGWFLFQIITTPCKSSDNSFPKISLTLEDLGKKGRLIQFQRKIKQHTNRMLHLVKTRPKEPSPGAWGNISPLSSCSFQPEDLVIESWGVHLKNRGKALLGEQRTRIRPFSTSLLDGLDFRETIRRWHEGRFYVSEHFQGNGEVGAVIVILEYDNGPKEKYPYKMSWYGENDQESDMALYSTMPGETMVGPGISRCEYGGFLMTYPPHNMWPIWEDPYITQFYFKEDILLAAALQITKDPNVVYAAPKPPSTLLKHLARRMGIKIIYMPLGTLSPDQINKIRHFHILDSHETRDIAPDYIFDK